MTHHHFSPRLLIPRQVFGVVLVPVNLKTRSHHSAMCHLGIVMERGLCNLFQLLVREELDLYLRLDLMRQLARALHHLHTGDPHIIHRDVKPQNVVVTEAERSERTGLLKTVRVKLIDLGWLGQLISIHNHLC